MGARRPLRVAAMIKQVPEFERMELGPDGRLRRDGLELEMNAYCRRAVSKGVELARSTGGTCTVFSLGPPSAEDVLREAVAWGADEGVLLTDPEFAGSDTLATARALAAALARAGAFDLVLVGRNSVDADTGQVGPELATLLDLPFATGVRQLELRDGLVWARCEHDDGWVTETVRLPAVLSAAERLCEPAKMPPEARAAVSADRISVWRARDLGPGPWGQDGSPTRVGEVSLLPVDRLGLRLVGSPEEQVGEAVDLLVDRAALGGGPAPDLGPVAEGSVGDGPVIGVVVEPGRERLARELLGAAAGLAAELGGRVVALASEPGPPGPLSSWGADEVVEIRGSDLPEDVVRGVQRWAAIGPWALLAPGTVWGREVAGRSAAALGAGLTGDAIDLVAEAGRLVARKPAFGGRTVAAVHCRSPVQMATVRAGVLPLRRPRPASRVPVRVIEVEALGRVTVEARTREDDLGRLAVADTVVAVGQGVDPEHYGELEGLLRLLGAELAATRKVTDHGWLPRARQVGITGHSIAPRLYLGLGLSGKFNHSIGVLAAGTILAVNVDREAPVFEFADIGIVGDWRAVVPHLERRLAAVLGDRGGRRDRPLGPAAGRGG